MGIDPHASPELDRPAATSNGDASSVDTAQTSSRAHVPVNFSRRTQLRVTVFALAAAVALVAVFILGQHSRNKTGSALQDSVRRSAEQPVAVDVVRVERAGTQTALSLPGEATSFYETVLYARTSGYLNKWLVDIGDSVKAGQVLATIDTPELDEQLNEARAKLVALQAEAHVAETSAQFAKVSAGRLEAAAGDDEGAVSKQERDQMKSQFDASTAKLEAAKAQVSLGNVEIKRLQTLESFKNVVAPFDGTITARSTDVGALVTAGSTTNTTPLFTISQTNQIRVFADVPQKAVPDVHVGMSANVTVRELPGRIFTGKVTRTTGAISSASRKLKVEVLVPNPDLALLPGMYLQVSFETTRSNPPLRVPASALAFGPHGPQVAVVGADGRVSFRDITIGRDLGDAIEVGSGLSGGESVALNIGNQVVEGERVDPHEQEAAPKPDAPTHVAVAGERSERARIAP
ncbi:MAG TPA: efflux RND transporter periplasmic adaptor subunit [Tepidisphaeraceae bacterium]|jgi:RND family efflux transporter MFP subunit|nr:efflux RND transporter periplasmic adaptor subunit [Tepidisphaeraceae bacterium]